MSYFDNPDSEEILEDIEIVLDVTFDGKPPTVYIFTKWTHPIQSMNRGEMEE